MSVDTTVRPSTGRAARSGAPRRPRRHLHREGLVGMAMASPAVVLLLVFFVVPVLLMFGLAFTNARLISPRPPHLVGFDNFVTLFGDDVFWASLRNTAYFAVIVVPVQAGLALVLAMLVNAKVPAAATSSARSTSCRS